jgi:hypothetical protein
MYFTALLWVSYSRKGIHWKTFRSHHAIGPLTSKLWKLFISVLNYLFNPHLVTAYYILYCRDTKMNSPVSRLLMSGTISIMADLSEDYMVLKWPGSHSCSEQTNHVAALGFLRSQDCLEKLKAAFQGVFRCVRFLVNLLLLSLLGCVLRTKLLHSISGFVRVLCGKVCCWLKSIKIRGSQLHSPLLPAFTCQCLPLSCWLG